ncbi:MULTISPECIES: hypothetical protein [Halorubrum]|uniref:Uncharacterized protein n=1 Tax=Halorubrum ezzemoulense TaxID=337243 RepID=A0A256K0G9_HALEZ|nr:MULTISPECIES: hypothetical protein [Halorubrum]OYR74286.1 hypothetical protein DJ84_24840 [Halorubrum ezzemoulense]PHQ41791.1 hypothetical protein Z052_13185 [Halorubrum sp. C191]QAY20851.1 hypothetical protein EO776_12895 [Halorubrum ezzemoulense]
MRFSRDRRGQSVVIGTVVLFGFLIVALSLYQVQIVPQQNGQTEFEHFEAVQNDLVELRTAISAAGQSERPQFLDVKLGTSYRTRTFTINPPDPAGTLRTSDAYNITITDDSGTTVNVSTRFIEYRPRYNEIESGSTWYDNSVLYVEETDSNRPAVIIEDQNILVDNDTLRLTAVQNDFSASGTRKVAVELYPTSNATNLSKLSGGLDVRIPTRLGSEDGYWNESIENGSVTYQGMDDAAYPESSEVSALLLRVDSPDNISVNSVGIQREPTGEATKDNIGPAGGGGSDGSDRSDGSGSGASSQISSDNNININSSGEHLFFRFDTGGSTFTIVNASVDTTNMPDGSRPDLNGIWINENRKYNAGSGGYASDGTTIDIDDTAVSGSTSIRFGPFTRREGVALPGGASDYTFQNTQPSGSYIVVNVGFNDGTTKTFYIEYSP